jgi:ABC-type multidrug transport system fused ATPase/permease subunit
MSDMVNKQLLARVWRDTRQGIDKPACLLLSKAFLLIVASTFLLNFAPIFVAKLIDQTISIDTTGGGQLVLYACLYLAFRFVGQVLSDFRWVTVNPVIYKIAYRQCADIAALLAAGNDPVAGAKQSAASISEQAGVIGKMNLSLVGILYGLVVVIFPAVLEFVVVLAVVASLVGAIAVAYVLVGMLIFFMSVFFMKQKELAQTRQAFTSDNLVFGYYGEYLSNASLINDFSAGPFLRQRLWAKIEQSVGDHALLFGTKTTRGVALSVLTGIAYAGVVLWAVVNAKAGLVSAGQFFLVVFYLDRVVQPMAAISTAVGSLQSSLVSMGIGYAALDEQLYGKGGAQANVRPVASSIALSSRHVFAIDDEVLHLGAPGVVVLTGASGAGKTTCLRWIYAKLKAATKADGEGSNAQATSLNYLVAEPLLIEGSVFENIALGATDIDPAAVEQVWGRWHWEFGNRFIASGEPVSALSAGEKQYVAVCRSLLRQPRMLFLDEATNSIDAASERAVMALLKQSLPASTILLVSHRSLSIRPDVLVRIGHGTSVSVEIVDQTVDHGALEAPVSPLTPA